MKNIIFDTSSVISLAVNNLLWTLEPLKEQFKGEFFISESVYKELIENPLKSKRYKLEAMMIEEMIHKGIITVYKSKKYRKEALEYLNLSNHTFHIKNKSINIIDLAEMESLVLAKKLKSSLYIVDERTIRLLLENPDSLASILKGKLQNNVDMLKNNLEIIKKEFKDIKIARSVELMLVAYNLGLFDKFMIGPRSRKIDFVDGLLWALKLHGCSVTENEIRYVTNSKII